MRATPKYNTALPVPKSRSLRGFPLASKLEIQGTPLREDELMESAADTVNDGLIVDGSGRILRIGENVADFPPGYVMTRNKATQIARRGKAPPANLVNRFPSGHIRRRKQPFARKLSLQALSLVNPPAYAALAVNPDAAVRGVFIGWDGRVFTRRADGSFAQMGGIKISVPNPINVAKDIGKGIGKGIGSVAKLAGKGIESAAGEITKGIKNIGEFSAKAAGALYEVGIEKGLKYPGKALKEAAEFAKKNAKYLFPAILVNELLLRALALPVKKAFRNKMAKPAVGGIAKAKGHGTTKRQVIKDPFSGKKRAVRVFVPQPTEEDKKEAIKYAWGQLKRKLPIGLEQITWAALFKVPGPSLAGDENIDDMGAEPVSTVSLGASVVAITGTISAVAVSLKIGVAAYKWAKETAKAIKKGDFERALKAGEELLEQAAQHPDAPQWVKDTNKAVGTARDAQKTLNDLKNGRVPIEWIEQSMIRWNIAQDAKKKIAELKEQLKSVADMKIKADIEVTINSLKKTVEIGEQAKRDIDQLRQDVGRGHIPPQIERELKNKIQQSENRTAAPPPPNIPQPVSSKEREREIAAARALRALNDLTTEYSNLPGAAEWVLNVTQSLKTAKQAEKIYEGLKRGKVPFKWMSGAMLRWNLARHASDKLNTYRAAGKKVPPAMQIKLEKMQKVGAQAKRNIDALRRGDIPPGIERKLKELIAAPAREVSAPTPPGYPPQPAPLPYDPGTYQSFQHPGSMQQYGSAPQYGPAPGYPPYYPGYPPPPPPPPYYQGPAYPPSYPPAYAHAYAPQSYPPPGPPQPPYYQPPATPGTTPGYPTSPAYDTEFSTEYSTYETAGIDLPPLFSFGPY